MASNQEAVVWVRAAISGARWIVCSAQCLARLAPDEWPEGFEKVRIEVEGECVHCYGCGTIVAEPWDWCVIHGLSCPEELWAHTAVARAFAAAYTNRARRPISDALWQAAETEWYHQPRLTGAELAELFPDSR